MDERAGHDQHLDPMPTGPLWSILLALAAAGEPARAGVPPLEVLFHADLDGRFASPACGKPGPPLPDYASLVAALEAARTPGAVALLGGNWSGPDPFAAALLGPGARQADALAAILARAHYDAIAIGHNELALEDATLDALLPRLAAATRFIVTETLEPDNDRAVYMREAQARIAAALGRPLAN